MSDFDLPKGRTVRRGQTPILPAEKAEDTPVNTPVTSEDDKKKDKSQDNNPKYSQEELLAIFDDIMFTGEFSETIKIRGKLSVTFRTRTSEEVDAIQRDLDAMQANLISTVESRRGVLSLMYSMTHYGNENLKAMDYKTREKRIGAIPAPVVAVLLDALSKFDQKVYLACKEGEENF